MSMRPRRKTITSKSIAAYASASGNTPNTTIATAPSRLAAGRLRCTKGNRWTAMRRYVRAKMTRPVVMGLWISDCGLRIGATGSRPSNPQSAIANPQSSDLPIREQHAVRGVRLGVSLVDHPQVGPADAIAAGHEATERRVEAGLAANGDP